MEDERIDVRPSTFYEQHASPPINIRAETTGGGFRTRRPSQSKRFKAHTNKSSVQNSIEYQNVTINPAADTINQLSARRDISEPTLTSVQIKINKLRAK